MSDKVKIAELERQVHCELGIALDAERALLRFARAANAVEQEKRRLEEERQRASARHEEWPLSHTGREHRLACEEYYRALEAFDFGED